MNRTETAEEKEWREASHPRLVKRLDDQRTALADLNRQVQSLTAELAKWRDACCADCLHSPCMCLVHGLEVERDTLTAKVAELQKKVAEPLTRRNGESH